MKTTHRISGKGYGQALGLGPTARAQEQEQAPPTTVDAVTVANIAAQPRFARQAPDSAAKAALDLVQKCQAAIDAHEQRCRERKAAKEQQTVTCDGKPIPQPKAFPAPPGDFLKLVVRPRDKPKGQARFNRFLLWWINETRKRIKYDPPIPGSDLPFIEGTPEAAQAVAKWFADYQELEKLVWDQLAEDYITWWANKKHEQKVNAGHVGAQKHRLKKVSESDAVTTVAAAARGIIPSESAAKAKKGYKLRKKAVAPLLTK